MILEHFLLKLHHWSALRVQSIPIGVKSILKKFIIFLSHEKCGQGAKCFDTEEKSVIRRELALSGPRWLPSLWSTNTWALFSSAVVRVKMGELEFFVEDWNIFFPIAWHTHLVVHQHSVEDEDERINRPNGKVACTSSWACPPHSRNEPGTRSSQLDHQSVKLTRC